MLSFYACYHSLIISMVTGFALSVHIVKLSLVCRFWIFKNLQSCEFVGFFGGEREREREVILCRP